MRTSVVSVRVKTSEKIKLDNHCIVHKTTVKKLITKLIKDLT